MRKKTGFTPQEKKGNFSFLSVFSEILKHCGRNVVHSELIVRYDNLYRTTRDMVI